MSYQDKIDAAVAAITTYNGNAEKPIDIDSFLLRLKTDGAVDEDALRTAKWEDLQKCGLPIFLARRVAEIFRKKEDEVQSVSKDKASGMTIEQLLERYDPSEDNAVTKQLRKRSKGLRCIVFNIDGTVNVNLSKKILGEIRDDFGDRETIKCPDTGEELPVFPVGQKALRVADENPLYPGKLLKPDGTCDQTNRSWKQVDLNVRQLLRIAIETKVIKVPITIDAAHDILDKAFAEDAFKALSSRYPKAMIEYRTREATGSLPSLKISLSAKQAGKRQDPFFSHVTT
tara:strand:- start:2431 stop:3288 length:858 start_codon:yes stop_codon:yes gene_type:complete